MSGRRIVTSITLVVLALVLVGMAVYGFNAVTAPLPGGSSASASPTCSAQDKQVKTTLKRSDVQVSVFNGGSRSGLANVTRDKLTTAGFKAGDIGNAPKGFTVRKVVVLAEKPNDTAAQLVAAAFGKKTRVVVEDQDLGPGVDVVVGNSFSDLARRAPQQIKLPTPVETCVKVD